MQRAKVSVQRNIELLHPQALCLVEFSHAILRKNQNKIKYEVYKGGIAFQKQKRMLAAFTDCLMYSGKNDDPDEFKITLTQLKVAVLNKSTNRIKLYDADYFVLRPILRCHLLQAVNEKNKFEQAQDLALEFGSKNKKKSVHSRLKFQSRGEDSVDASLLKKVTEEAPLITESATTIESPNDAIIPLQNKNATNVAEVYNIFDIISQEEYDALDSIALFRNISSETLQLWKKESKLKDIIINYLELYYQSLTPVNEKLLCYLNYMMHFLGLKVKEFKKKDPIPEVPEPFKTKLMSRYVINKLVNIAYALGCHVFSSKNEDTKKIELKLPLYEYKNFGRRK